MKKVTAQKVESTSLALIFPLMAVLGIVPLVVYLYAYDCGMTSYDFYLTPEDYEAISPTVDFFLYWKMIVFCVIAAFMAIVLVFKLVAEGKKIKFAKVFIPLGAYGLLALVSSIFSQHKPYPFTGIYEQFEPVWALLGYCVVAYYAFLYINTEKDLTRVMAALAFSTIVMLLLGMTQAFGTDFFKTKVGASLILPLAMQEEGAGALDFKFEAGRVYLTLYNPNYVGSYVALLMPMFMLLVIGLKKVWQKVLSGVLAAGLILVLLGSQSRAGFVGVFASLILVLVVFNKRLLKYWAPIVAAIIILVGVIVGYDIYKGGLIRDKIASAFNPTPRSFDLSKIETLDDEVVLTYKGNDLHLGFEYDAETGSLALPCYDGDGNALSMSEDNMNFRITDERFADALIYPISSGEEGELGFAVDLAGRSWYFFKKDGTFYMYSTYGKLIKAVNTESVKWLEARAGFASGRGFIWSKTIPLLKHNIVLGTGADTFIFEFPNYDFLSMYNGGYNGQIMTRPHNMYLQMGVQTGVLSVIAVLVYYAWFFFYGIITMFRVSKHNFTSILGAGILCGTFGYMVVQIINDSSITVAPLYWTLTGVGLAAFRMVRESDIYVTKVEK